MSFSAMGSSLAYKRAIITHVSKVNIMSGATRVHLSAAERRAQIIDATMVVLAEQGIHADFFRADPRARTAEQYAPDLVPFRR